MRKGGVSGYKQERLLELFIVGATAGTAIVLVGVHRNTAAYYLHHLRIIIKVIPGTKIRTLLPIIEARIYPNRIVYTDSYSNYDVLDVSCFKYYRVNIISVLWIKKMVKITSTGLRIFGCLSQEPSAEI